MDKDKLIRILEGLIENTNKKVLDWNETANPNTFLTSLQGSAVSVTYMNLVGLESINFDFRDESGVIFESEIVRKFDKELWKKAAEVYNLARHVALKIDEKNKKIDNILKQLESGKTAI